MKQPLMKSITSFTLCLACWAPFSALAGYKALLKTGEELYVSNYWVDRVDQEVIRLLVDGSMTRIPRNEVLYIAPTSAMDQHCRTAVKRITFALRTQAVNEAESPPADETTADTTSAQPPSSLQVDAEHLYQSLEMAKEDYRKILQNGDEIEGHQEARNRIQELTGELNDLREQAKAGNRGELPGWWRW